MTQHDITFGVRHADRIAAHYNHACEKHPYFCDWVRPAAKTPEQTKIKIDINLARCRETIKRNASRGILGWDDLLDCEMWEVFEALASDNNHGAVEELYDMVAVILRAVDVIEGRQPLGKGSAAPAPSGAMKGEVNA